MTFTWIVLGVITALTGVATLASDGYDHTIFGLTVGGIILLVVGCTVA